MAFPTYFRTFPNIKYAISVNKSGIGEYINIKDFFHLLKVRDDILKEDTLYTEYSIENGERPENVSFKLYGDEQYYWVLLQINDIVDYYNQWPLSSFEFEEHIIKKYKTWAIAEQIHHWETVETFDDDGNLVMPGGVVVNQDYVFHYPNIPGSGDDVVERSSFPTPVSNLRYEQRLNEKKSNIVVLKELYIPDYVRETANYMRLREPQNSEVNISQYFR